MGQSKSKPKSKSNDIKYNLKVNEDKDNLFRSKSVNSLFNNIDINNKTFNNKSQQLNKSKSSNVLLTKQILNTKQLNKYTKSNTKLNILSCSNILLIVEKLSKQIIQKKKIKKVKNNLNLFTKK